MRAEIKVERGLFGISSPYLLAKIAQFLSDLLLYGMKQFSPHRWFYPYSTAAAAMYTLSKMVSHPI